MENNKSLQGSITALITPFKDDFSVDFDSLAKIIKWQVDNEINGIVINGTTGESINIIDEELVEIIKSFKHIYPNLPLIVGVGGNSTKQVIDKIKLISNYKPDYILAVTPYYNKPNQEGIYQHFTAIAEISDIDIILYNNPGRTMINMDIATIKKLRQKHNNIVAIKESLCDVTRYFELCQIDTNFTVLCDNDAMAIAAHTMGVKGAISVLPNIIPDITVDLHRKCANYKYSSALDLVKQFYKLNKLLFIESNPMAVKFALSKLGLCNNILRLPLTPLSNEHHQTLLTELKKFYDI